MQSHLGSSAPPPLSTSALPPPSAGGAGGVMLDADGNPLPYDAHSPQSTGSPEPPSGILTDAEAKLWDLVLSIHSVQTRFNRPMVNGGVGVGVGGPNASASGVPGVNGTSGAGGAAANSASTISHQQLMLAEPVQVILRKMMEVDEIAAVIPTMIPRQAVEDLDNTHHPGHVVKERIEAVALENAFLNGKISAVSSFRDMLGDALAESFPELGHLRSNSSASAAANPASGGAPANRPGEQNMIIKTEEP
ncbi:hypothetical protein CPB86DRAFT_787741 [Serendipita vermifera]|nr:hypothetical protein CPB86DRAFT_787741 [Serendipita vermifera]